MKSGGEGGLESDDEGDFSTDEDKFDDVDGKDVEEFFGSYCEDGGIHDGQKEAKGDEPSAKKSLSSPESFMDTLEGLGELANEASADGGRRVVALGLLRLHVRDDVGVEESRGDVHLLNLEVVLISRVEEDM